MWLIGGAALYFLTRKKAVEPSTDKPSSDVGNQANDFPKEDRPNRPNKYPQAGGTKASLPPAVAQPAAPRVNIAVVDSRPTPSAVGTPPQIVQKQTKGYSIE